MKYVLARNSHSAGMFYHYYGDMFSSSWFPKGTKKLSEASIFETADSALKTLQDDERLKQYGYFVRVIENKELFEAKLKDK